MKKLPEKEVVPAVKAVEKAEAKKAGGFSAQITFGMFGRVRFLDKLMFTKHLALMLKSGIPLSEAISILQSETRSAAFTKVLTTIQQGVNNGLSLAKILGGMPNVFDSLYVSIVGIGEESGNLEANLEYLSGTMAKAYEFKKKVQGALFYPAIVVSAAVVSGTIMAVFVLPKLVDLFTSLDVKLPLSTKILLWVAEVMKDYGVVILIGVVGMIVGLGWLIRTPKVKPKWHQLLLRIPVFGKLMQNMQVASLCRNLGVMLRSGLPITQALSAAAGAADNLVYKDYLKRMLTAVTGGGTLEKELVGKSYPFVPLVVARMIGVGEKTGKLDETLIYLADFFDDEVEDTTKNLSTIIEPILLIGIAIVVGFVAISVISPIYQLSGGLGQ